jgi:predicted O-methyltransferase YrrM
MTFSNAAKYLKYIIISKHKYGYGIHSPFVFDLVTRVFRNKIDADIVCCIEKVRKKLIADRRLIVVNDLGTGSEKLKSNKRKVSDIARYSPVPKKYGVLLSNMAAEFGHPLIVEFGTSFGISTMYMAAANSETKLYSMEGSQSVSEIAIANFKYAGLDNINVLTGSFDEMWSDAISSGIKPGLVFIDGNHRKEPVLKYFNQVSEISGNDTVVIIDDIYFSKEMESAWNEIKHSGKVTLTIDIFRMGIVFFREGITNQNYTIRY